MPKKRRQALSVKIRFDPESLQWYEVGKGADDIVLIDVDAGNAGSRSINIKIGSLGENVALIGAAILVCHDVFKLPGAHTDLV